MPDSMGCHRRQRVCRGTPARPLRPQRRAGQGWSASAGRSWRGGEWYTGAGPGCEGGSPPPPQPPPLRRPASPSAARIGTCGIRMHGMHHSPGKKKSQLSKNRTRKACRRRLIFGSRTSGGSEVPRGCLQTLTGQNVGGKQTAFPQDKTPSMG